MNDNILDRNVEEYKGYAIRVIPQHPSIIAVPLDAICFYHPVEDYETGDQAIEKMKKLIDEKE